MSYNDFLTTQKLAKRFTICEATAREILKSYKLCGGKFITEKPFKVFLKDFDDWYFSKSDD